MSKNQLGEKTFGSVGYVSSSFSERRPRRRRIDRNRDGEFSSVRFFLRRRSHPSVKNTMANRRVDELAC